MGKLIVSLSPHAHGTDSVERNMYGVIVALVPALLASFYFFGLGSVVVCATSVLACVFFEWAITKFILNREQNTIMDGSFARFQSAVEPSCMDNNHRCAYRYRSG